MFKFKFNFTTVLCISILLLIVFCFFSEYFVIKIRELTKSKITYQLSQIREASKHILEYREENGKYPDSLDVFDEQYIDVFNSNSEQSFKHEMSLPFET